MVWCSHTAVVRAPRLSANAAISIAAAYSSVVDAPNSGARMSKRIRNMGGSLGVTQLSGTDVAGGRCRDRVPDR